MFNQIMSSIIVPMEPNTTFNLLKLLTQYEKPTETNNDKSVATVAPADINRYFFCVAGP